MEREDFTRLKKVQAKKAEKQKIDGDEKAAKLAAELAQTAKDLDISGGNPIMKPATAANTNVLSGFDAADDEDVVFK